jgi:hypothetical protein
MSLVRNIFNGGREKKRGGGKYEIKRRGIKKGK